MILVANSSEKAGAARRRAGALVLARDEAGVAGRDADRDVATEPPREAARGGIEIGRFWAGRRRGITTGSRIRRKGSLSVYLGGQLLFRRHERLAHTMLKCRIQWLSNWCNSNGALTVTMRRWPVT